MKTTIMKIPDPTRRLFEFARERHSIYEKRQAGVPPPWTDDPILRDYRFTNVYREIDRVTKWIHEHWLLPRSDDPDVWFAMCVARLLNQPESLAAVGYPVPWDRRWFNGVLRRRRKEKKRNFNAAYIVSTGGMELHKEDYLADEVLEPLWQARVRLRPNSGDTLNSWHMLLGQMQGFGSFMSAQVVADIKHVAPLSAAVDWWTFAASGPGSRRGLNYVLQRERAAPWTEEEWRFELGRLRDSLEPLFQSARMKFPDAQNVQNILCEWSKYYRAATVGKMPKQLYRWKPKQEERKQHEQDTPTAGRPQRAS
jgi:hypothetical protein